MAKKTVELSAKDKARLSNRANVVWHFALGRDKASAPTKAMLEIVIFDIAARAGVDAALNTHHDRLLLLAKDVSHGGEKAESHEEETQGLSAQSGES